MTTPNPLGRRKRSLRWWILNVVLPLIFVAALVYVVVRQWDELTKIFEDPNGDLVRIAVLVTLGHFLNSAEFWLLYRAQGVPLGLWENWMMFTAGQLGNLLPGQVGTIYRFKYLKTVHGLSYSRSGSSFGVNLVVTFGSSAVAGLVGLFVVSVRGGSPAWWLFAVFGGIGVASLVAMMVPLPSVGLLRGTPARIWSAFRKGWEELRSEPLVALAVLGIDLAKYVMVAWRFQLAFSLLGVDESFWYFLVIAPAAGIAGALSFTPGGIGIRELFVTAVAAGLGSTLDTGLLAATIDRGVMLAVSIVFGSIGYGVTWRRMKEVEATRAVDDPGGAP